MHMEKSGLLERLVAGVGRELLRFATFSRLVVTTKISDMEDGLSSGGHASCIEVVRDYRGEKNVRVWHLHNRLVSCIYRSSPAFVNGKLARTETLDMIRRDMDGGAILYFTNAELSGGITNAVPRAFFHEEENQCALRLLATVRERVKAEREAL